MKIIVDGNLTTPPEKLIFEGTLELLKWVEKNVIPESNCFIDLFINGEKIPLDPDISLIRNLPLLMEVNRIKINSTNTRELAIDTLGEIKNYLERLYSGLKNTAKFFRDGEDEQGLQLYQQCVEVISTIFPPLFTVDRLLGLDFTEVTYEGVPISEKISLLNQHFVAITEATSNQDYARLSDIIEYDLASEVETWFDILSQLLSSIPNTEQLS